MVDYKTFELGDFTLQRGVVLPNAKLVYAAIGTLNDAKDNVVLFPTWGSGTPEEAIGLMTGPGRALDPEKYFIIVPNHFGGGLSSSPSNTAPPFDAGRFPRATVYDSVVAQRRLLNEVFGIARLRLVAGYSMGAPLAYHWAALFPDDVRAIVPIAGAARTGQFNKVFLAGIRSAIMSDPDWNEGFYGDRPPIRGIRQFARVTPVGDSPAFTVRRCSRRPSERHPSKSLSRRSGRHSSSSATRTICWPKSGRGSTTTFPLTRGSGAIWRRRYRPSRPGQS